MLSCSAVAKGYAVDVIAQLLEKKGIGNFMHIGGEVVVRGENRLWRIGQADRRLARRKPRIADHTASYRCGHSPFCNLPKLLLQRRQKICPYYRPAHRLSGAAQYPVGHSDYPATA